ncbi:MULTISPECIES: hypothetical protein [unclassified Calothrix]|nr:MULTISPECIES: hypothetical protein [unclassified Calothrix]
MPNAQCPMPNAQNPIPFDGVLQSRWYVWNKFPFHYGLWLLGY